MANKPKITLISPKNNDTITGQTVTFRVNASAPRNVKKVEYYIDDLVIAINSQSPFTTEEVVIPNRVLNGEHTLTAKAYDDLGNSAEYSITINLDREAYLNINWLEPSGGTTLK